MMCLRGGNSQLGPGWAGGRVEGEKGISLSSTPCSAPRASSHSPRLSRIQPHRRGLLLPSHCSSLGWTRVAGEPTQLHRVWAGQEVGSGELSSQPPSQGRQRLRERPSPVRHPPSSRGKGARPGDRYLEMQVMRLRTHLWRGRWVSGSFHLLYARGFRLYHLLI